MTSLVPRRGRLRVTALPLALGIWVISGSPARCDDAALPVEGSLPAVGPQGHHETGAGTLGYGGPGLYPGFYGFGLGYCLGYGYGGKALGVGADGGYPFYGGPGYPHCEPLLRRLKHITPFPYYGGPGYPTPDHPNFYGATGPLVGDQPVVTIGGDPGTASGY